MRVHHESDQWIKWLTKKLPELRVESSWISMGVIFDMMLNVYEEAKGTDCSGYLFLWIVLNLALLTFWGYDVAVIGFFVSDDVESDLFWVWLLHTDNQFYYPDGNLEAAPTIGYS